MALSKCNQHILENYFDNQEPCHIFLLKNDLLTGQILAGKHEGWYFPTIRPYINKDSIAIEGGSYVGDHTLWLGKEAKKVYAFEIQTDLAEILEKNLEINNITNVDVHNMALSDSTNDVSIKWHSNGNKGGCGLDTDNKKPVVENPIKATTIDLLVQQEETKNNQKIKIDIILLDIEGYEPKVLTGGIETIKRDKPVILVESHSGSSPLDFIVKLGYDCISVSGANYLLTPKLATTTSTTT
jgi:FkbM family methyltransferase